MSWKPARPPFVQYKKKVFANAAKVATFIYQIGEYPALRQPSQEIVVSQITAIETQKKIAYLKKCLVQYRKLTGYGRGIAAVQVGIPERFAVVYTPEKLLVIINPRITKQAKVQLHYPEMCMSANPVIAPVARPAWIEFTYYNELGNLQQWNAKSDTQSGKILNRVFAHEIDHLEGIINIDRVLSSRELILESDPDFYKTASFSQV